MKRIKKLVGVRSPLWQIIMICLFYPTALLIIYMRSTPSSDLQAVIAASALSLVIALVVTSIIIRTLRYNRRNPSHKVNLTGITPAELKEEDEGMQMITAKATRQTYIYDSFALPLLSITLIFLPYSPYTTLSAVILVALGHYLTYMRYIWKAL